LELATEHVVAREEVEITLQSQHTKHTGVGGNADAGVACFNAMERSAGDASAFGDRLSGITAAQPSQSEALTESGKLAGRRREERGSGPWHDVSYFSQKMDYLSRV
jgi:hypothetical protein